MYQTATDLTNVAAHDRLENSDQASTLCAASASTSWDAGQELAIRVVVTIAAILSIIGASFIIITYILHPQLRKPAYQLILALSIAGC